MAHKPSCIRVLPISLDVVFFDIGMPVRADFFTAIVAVVLGLDISVAFLTVVVEAFFEGSFMFSM